MAASQHMDRQTFLRKVRQSGLLTDRQLAEVADRLPETDRGRPVARALVEHGLLTRFQAERILAGLTGGFVLGQYVILDQLGQGGMGRVFKAEHRTMSRMVALKVLAPHLLKTSRAQELFQREVRAAARLLHPNIVTAYDANQVGERHYLVLEYVDGPNLEQLVRERGPLPVGQACEFVRQVAGGLQYAHEMGMVHRDIKPGNILLQRNAAGQATTAKLSDFGLARLHGGEEGEGRPDTVETKQNTILGTPDFLSPEQARNLHQADIRSDLYSLGCTLYYLLTGKVPFPGGTTLEKLVRHNTEEPTPVEELRPDVPPAVAEVVRRLMAKAPADRFQTPAELAAALAPFGAKGSGSWPSLLLDEDASALTATAAGATTPGPVPADGPVGDEDSILASTLPAGSPSSVSGAGLSSSRLPQAARSRQRLQLWIAVAAAVGIVGSAVAAAALLSQVL